jgi:hypothetical protein
VVARWRDTRRSRFLRCTVFAAMTLLVWCTWLAAGQLHPASAAPVTIDFEDLPAGTARLPQSGSFAVQGVQFDGGTVTDFSSAKPPLDKFAHSGSQAVEVCGLGDESCHLTMTFRSHQALVSLWVSFAPESTITNDASTEAPAVSDNVRVIGYDDSENEITRTESRSVTSDGPALINEQLAVSSTIGAIHKVEVRLANNIVGVLAFDDVAFEPPNAELTISPRSLDFGPAQSGANQPQMVTVENTGNVLASITGLDTPSDFRVLDQDCLGQPLAPTGSCTVEVQRLSAAAAGPDAALSLSTDTPAGTQRVRLVAAAAATTTSASTTTTVTTRPDAFAGGPTGGGGSDTARTIIIAVLAAAALAALGTATYLWMRPSTPLHVVVLPAPTVQTLGGSQPPTTVTVRFDPSTGTVEWTDRSRE